jgi:alkanesulfonate monooxygenase SsuD/methylene tetrahydromethanopterin reductase-like flavin-dependent oxidoreductase (luciferase family)
MKFYAFEELTYPTLPTDTGPEVRFSNRFCDPRMAAQNFLDHLDEWALAEELGFDGALVNEHHFTGFNTQPDCNVMAAAIISRTKQMKVGVIGNILPLRHPLQVAESFAMLDCLSGGRFIPGIVRGIPAEYASYNVDPFSGRERFSEAYEIIQRALSEEVFDYEGKFWNLTRVSIWPRPIQNPLGPFWMPAGSMESIRFAAERRIVACQVFQPTSGFKECFDQYRKFAREEFGWQPGYDQFAGARFIHIAETNEQAMKDGLEMVSYLFRVTGRPVVNPAPMPGLQTDRSYQHRKNLESDIPAGLTAASKGVATIEMAQMEKYRNIGFLLCGDPDFVGNWLVNDAKTAGYGNLITSFHVGCATHEQALKSKKLFAKYIMPELSKINVDPLKTGACNGGPRPYEVRSQAGAEGVLPLYGDFNYVLSRDAVETLGVARRTDGKTLTVGWEMRVPDRAEDGSPTQIIFPAPCREHRGSAIRLRAVAKGGGEISDDARVFLEAHDENGGDRQTIFDGKYRQFAAIEDQHAANAAIAAQNRGVAGDRYSIFLGITVPPGAPEPDLDAEESFFELECFKHLVTITA